MNSMFENIFSLVHKLKIIIIINVDFGSKKKIFLLFKIINKEKTKITPPNENKMTSVIVRNLLCHIYMNRLVLMLECFRGMNRKFVLPHLVLQT